MRYLGILLIFLVAGCATDRYSPAKVQKGFWNQEAPISCFGLEPFWDVDVKNQSLVLSITEKNLFDQRLPAPEIEAGKDRFKLAGGKGRKTYILELERKECFTVTDKTHPWEATFFYRDLTYRGCCYRAEPDHKRASPRRVY